jgi:hypothetical protein
MKVFLISVVTAIVVAVGAVYALDSSLQLQADQAFMSPTSVRLPSHGTTHNLVGKDWYSAKEH